MLLCVPAMADDDDSCHLTSREIHKHLWRLSFQILAHLHFRVRIEHLDHRLRFDEPNGRQRTRLSLLEVGLLEVADQQAQVGVTAVRFVVRTCPRHRLQLDLLILIGLEDLFLCDDIRQPCTHTPQVGGINEALGGGTQCLV